MTKVIIPESGLGTVTRSTVKITGSDEFEGNRVQFCRACTAWPGIDRNISAANWDIVYDNNSKVRRIKVELVGPEMVIGVLFMCMNQLGAPVWWISHKMGRGGSSQMDLHGLGRTYRLDIKETV